MKHSFIDQKVSTDNIKTDNSCAVGAAVNSSSSNSSL